MKRCVIILCVLCAIFSVRAFGQTLNWSSATGPYSSSISAFLSVGDTLYSGVSSGIGQGLYRSLDGGKSWTPVPASGSIYDLTISGKHTLFAGGSAGVMASLDHGATWAVRDTGLPLFATAYAIKYLDGALYLCLGSDGFYKSTDDGKSWIAPNSSAAGIVANAVIASGKSIIVAEASGTFLSTNNGVSWSEPLNELSNIAIHVFFGIGGKVFAGTDNGVYISTDNGLTWPLSVSGIPADVSIGSLSVSADGKTMYAGALRGSFTGLYQSGDTGKTWHFLYNDIWGYPVNSLFVTPSAMLAGTDICIFNSTDNGKSWQNSSQGLPEVNVRSLASNGGRLFAGSEGSFILETDDQGDHWHAQKNGLTRPNVRALVSRGDTIFAGTDAQPKLQRGGIHSSTDNGASWSLANGVPFIGINAFLDNGSALFAGADSGIYSSTNNGANWINSGNGITDTVLALGANSNWIFAGTKNGLYASTNNGLSWSYNLLKGIGKKGVYAFITVGTEAFVGTDSGIYHSSENYPWQLVSVDTLDVRCLWANPFIIAAGTTKGIYLSSDNGKTWQFQPSAGKIPITALASANKNLYAATTAGALKAPMGIFAAVKSQPENSLSLEVTNPSRNQAIIRYSLSSPGDISIAAFDLKGAQYSVLSTRYSPAGTNEITCDTSKLPSGIYIVRVISNGQQKSIKITIAK